MNILHIEDSLEDAELVRDLLTGEWPDCRIHVTCKRDEILQHLRDDSFDLILSDFSMGAFTGLDALKIVQQECPLTPFIFLSGTIGEDRAIEAVRAGAQDYVLKDRMKRLITAIQRAMRDTHQRKQRDLAEQRIREQADLLNKARDAIIVTNLEGVITFWNQGAERVCGWDSGEVLGRRLADVLGVGAVAGIETARKALEEKDEWRGEFHLHNKLGKLLVMEISASLIRDENGEPKARLSICTDVTAKKNLEEQFLRVQRLESIGMLASGIAHDLNNVLAPILMAAPVLRVNVTDPGDLRIIASLERSAERGAGLVRQILAFAHGVSGSHQLIQVKHLLRDTVSVIEETFPKNILLEERFANDLWPTMGNPTQIHQILLNLCVNARDAMPEGGTLTILAENCMLDYLGAQAFDGASPGPWLVLHVEDSGTGIPPEVLAHIWEPFYTTKGVGKGTGLGLSTVRGIVENHNGFIELKTQPGHGTAIRVYLPAAEVTTNGEKPVSAHPFAIRGNGELVLIVDDEATIREISAATLSHYGYRVLIARDGTEAVALFATRSREIKLVITDISMPNLDGAHLAVVVHQLNPAVKILAMSGLNSGGPDREHTKDFANAFLTKPFKAEALLHTVHRLLHTEPSQVKS
jgi:two-component system cell cycle sensor histidine kinase/response regulator CckA